MFIKTNFPLPRFLWNLCFAIGFTRLRQMPLSHHAGLIDSYPLSIQNRAVNHTANATRTYYINIQDVQNPPSFYIYTHIYIYIYVHTLYHAHSLILALSPPAHQSTSPNSFHHSSHTFLMLPFLPSLPSSLPSFLLIHPLFLSNPTQTGKQTTIPKFTAAKRPVSCT